MGLLDALIYGVRDVFFGSSAPGTQVPRRSRVLFRGADAEDDPINDQTIVDFTGAAGIDASGGVAQDILVHNGTAFVRKAKGTNGQVLGVSGGVVGYVSPAAAADSDERNALTLTETPVVPVTIATYGSIEVETGDGDLHLGGIDAPDTGKAKRFPIRNAGPGSLIIDLEDTGFTASSRIILPGKTGELAMAQGEVRWATYSHSADRYVLGLSSMSVVDEGAYILVEDDGDNEIDLDNSGGGDVVRTVHLVGSEDLAVISATAPPEGRSGHLTIINDAQTSGEGGGVGGLIKVEDAGAAAGEEFFSDDASDIQPGLGERLLFVYDHELLGWRLLCRSSTGSDGAEGYVQFSNGIGGFSSSHGNITLDGTGDLHIRAGGTIFQGNANLMATQVEQFRNNRRTINTFFTNKAVGALTTTSNTSAAIYSFTLDEDCCTDVEVKMVWYRGDTTQCGFEHSRKRFRNIGGTVTSTTQRDLADSDTDDVNVDLSITNSTTTVSVKANGQGTGTTMLGVEVDWISKGYVQ